MGLVLDKTISVKRHELTEQILVVIGCRLEAKQKTIRLLALQCGLPKYTTF
jgi:hypothetical protein